MEVSYRGNQHHNHKPNTCNPSGRNHHDTSDTVAILL